MLIACCIVATVLVTTFVSGFVLGCELENRGSRRFYESQIVDYGWGEWKVRTRKAKNQTYPQLEIYLNRYTAEEIAKQHSEE